MNKILRISIIVVICLIVILAVALLISQCSSKDPADTTAPSTTEPSSTNTTPSATTPSETTPSETTPSETTPSETTPSDDPVVNPEPDDFTETNDKVYVITTKLNIRVSASAEADILASVAMDTELTRLGDLDNGWSKIEYNGEEAYVSTKYITTEKPIVDFTEVEETTYVTGKNALVFSKPSHLEGYSEEIATLFIGESVTRLGVAKTVYVAADDKEYTFAKVTFKIDDKDVIGYVNNAYLTTAEETDAGVVFEESSDVLVVIAETSIAIRKSTLYVEGDDSEIARFAFNGDELQATHKGVEESDGTVWYKVKIEDVTYYVIFKEANLQVKTPAAE